jgi:phospholipid N-methyltransferase
VKGFNLQVQELRDALISNMNISKLPVTVKVMVLSDLFDSMKDAEGKMIQLEKQAYEKELAEKEGAENAKEI